MKAKNDVSGSCSVFVWGQEIDDCIDWPILCYGNT